MGIIGNPFEDGQLEKRIKEMEVGESGFIMPISLGFRSDGNAYLHTGMPVRPEPSQHTPLQIRRTGKGDNNYLINIKGVNYKWYPLDDPFGSFLVQGATELDIVEIPYEKSRAQRIIPNTTSRTFTTNPPKNESQELQDLLNAAIKLENYEAAAKIRDQLKKLGN